MQEWNSLFGNRALLIGMIGFFSAGFLKVIVVWITGRKFKPSRVFGSGGMPSSHAAFAMSLTMAIGFQEGFGSAIFALAAAFAIVVMYDAAGVRRAAGKQAAVLNKVIENLLENGEWITNEQLKELVGHTPIEVLAGALLGIFIAVLMA